MTTMSMPPSLEGKSVVIVGASSGIGKATAELVSSLGARVIALARSSEKLDLLSPQLTGRHTLAPLNMLDEQAVNTFFEGLGTVEHLVLTAVADENSRRRQISSLTTEQMERSLDKVRGYFFIIRACVPHLAERATITLLSGASALRPPRQGMALLAAANGAIITFGHALALELAPVRVNVITPGAVDTSVWTPEERISMKKWAESELPARYFAQPHSIAQAILFVMTNPNMTGQNLIIDGGLTAQ